MNYGLQVGDFSFLLYSSVMLFISQLINQPNVLIATIINWGCVTAFASRANSFARSFGIRVKIIILWN